MKYDYGQTVIVHQDAPAIYRPGALGAICGMNEEAPKTVETTAAPITPIETYTVEYSDGSSIEVPGIYLSLYTPQQS